MLRRTGSMPAFTPTAADLAALDAAIYSGAETVKYQDRTVTYRSLVEMRALRAIMSEAIDGTPRRATFTLIAPSRR